MTNSNNKEAKESIEINEKIKKKENNKKAIKLLEKCNKMFEDCFNAIISIERKKILPKNSPECYNNLKTVLEDFLNELNDIEDDMSGWNNKSDFNDYIYILINEEEKKKNKEGIKERKKVEFILSLNKQKILFVSRQMKLLCIKHTKIINNLDEIESYICQNDKNTVYNSNNKKFILGNMEIWMQDLEDCTGDLESGIEEFKFAINVNTGNIYYTYLLLIIDKGKINLLTNTFGTITRKNFYKRDLNNTNDKKANLKYFIKSKSYKLLMYYLCVMLQDYKTFNCVFDYFINFKKCENNNCPKLVELIESLVKTSPDPIPNINESNGENLVTLASQDESFCKDKSSIVNRNPESITENKAKGKEEDNYFHNSSLNCSSSSKNTNESNGESSIIVASEDESFCEDRNTEVNINPDPIQSEKDNSVDIEPEIECGNEGVVGNEYNTLTFNSCTSLRGNIDGNSTTKEESEGSMVFAKCFNNLINEDEEENENFIHQEYENQGERENQNNDDDNYPKRRQPDFKEFPKIVKRVKCEGLIKQPLP